MYGRFEMEPSESRGSSDTSGRRQELDNSIEACSAEGINVNITLIFSLDTQEASLNRNSRSPSTSCRADPRVEISRLGPRLQQERSMCLSSSGIHLQHSRRMRMREPFYATPWCGIFPSPAIARLPISSSHRIVVEYLSTFPTQLSWIYGTDGYRSDGTAKGSADR
jgi:hypothetical protein